MTPGAAAVPKVAGAQEGEAGLGVELLAREAEDAARAGAGPHLAEHVVVSCAGEGAAEVAEATDGAQGVVQQVGRLAGSLG